MSPASSASAEGWRHCGISTELCVLINNAVLELPLVNSFSPGRCQESALFHVQALFKGQQRVRQKEVGSGQVPRVPIKVSWAWKTLWFSSTPLSRKSGNNWFSWKISCFCLSIACLLFERSSSHWQIEDGLGYLDSNTFFLDEWVCRKLCSATVVGKSPSSSKNKHNRKFFKIYPK